MQSQPTVLWVTVFLCRFIFSFFVVAQPRFLLTSDIFLWPLLLGKKINSLCGSKHWYLFQSTCLQTRWCALEWLYLGSEDSCLCQDHRMTCLFQRSVKWWVVTSLVRQSYNWLQYLPGSAGSWLPICYSLGEDRVKMNIKYWFQPSAPGPIL